MLSKVLVFPAKYGQFKKYNILTFIGYDTYTNF